MRKNYMNDFDAINEQLPDVDFIPRRKLQRLKLKDKRKAARLNMSICSYLGQYAPIWQAKKLARRIGLTYWPALIRYPVRDKYNDVLRPDGRGYVREKLKCNPMAFVFAEKVLQKKYGLWELGSRNNRGGWDSQGYYGISNHDVERMWFAAGCKNNKKFRMQVASGVTAKKGDTIPWLRNYIKGQQWWNKLIPLRLHYFFLCRKTLAVLGKLPWYCRWAAVNKLITINTNTNENNGRYIRIRDLDWNAVKKVSEAFQNNNIKAVYSYFPPRAIAKLNNIPLSLNIDFMKNQVKSILCPAYPKVSFEIAKQIHQGISPVEISKGKLTRIEAHQWLKEGGDNSPKEWLSKTISAKTNTEFHHRSIKVLRWMSYLSDNKDRWNAITRIRTMQRPGGIVQQFRGIDVLDEICDDDIHTGKDSVELVLRRASERLGEAYLTEAAKDHRILCPMPSWANKLGKYCKVLRTPAELVNEGKTLGHCVGGYASAVESGQCWILSIKTPNGERSTVELSPQLQIRQHRGKNNSYCSMRHTKLLHAILNRVHGVKRRT